jgi:pyruvate dehydrogenase E2 component (dihydrolipoamide acetyltransferase)
VQVSDRIDILVPEFGHGLTDALVVEWRVSVGDAVQRGDVVAVLETDKSSVDLMAEKAGTVVEIVVDARSITTSGSVLYRLDEQPRKAAGDVTHR